MKRILIVTGQSGSGKSSALQVLEDLGYYCIDNLPLALLPEIVSKLDYENNLEQLALGVDVRSTRADMQEFDHVFEQLQKHGTVDIIYLTTQDQDQQTTQQIYDLNHLANNLEKRVSDLQVLQQSAMQTLPMIRIIQSNNLMLVDKFYAIKNITLPAWKNQISLAISLQEQKNSVQLAKAIDDTTNELLRRNAELLHQNSVDTAKANQRSVIDVETLEHVQNTLIKTVNDVIQIQKEGMQKRAEATTRLRALQDSLNHLVLENSGQNPPKNLNE